MADRVAIEHMIDLVNALSPTLQSVWFSFPMASLNYSSHMISLLYNYLPQHISIYYEAGCPEAYGDTDRHVDSLAIFDLFDSIYKNTSVARYSSASVFTLANACYLVSWWGTSGMNRLKAVSLPGQFGRSEFS